MFELHLLLAALVVLAGRIVLVYARPQRTCRWCHGERKRRRCWRCRGDGHVWRLGARIVHKTHIAARNAWLESRYETSGPGTGRQDSE
jgi:hypothetical protein